MMKFGDIAIGEAAGAILAHGVNAGGRRWPKGRLLGAADVAELAALGLARITVARLEAGDIGEDEAAARVAGLIAGPGVRVSAAATGRVNLHAEHLGLAIIDADLITRINLVDEGLTVATVEPFAVAAAGQLLATVKVIPYAVDGAVPAAIEAAVGAAAPVLSLRPFTGRRVGLVLTARPGMKESLFDKARAVTNERLAAFEVALTAVRRCGHEASAVAAALADLAPAHDILLILGAASTGDRADVVPAGIEAAGGQVDHFGMPVDPGNLLILGRLGGKPVIGMPGCARSPKLNGFDWVLRRLMAGLPVTGPQLAAMGAGGLLKEISERPRPREQRRAKPKADAPRVAALVLAAGRSMRMGAANKLLQPVGGAPMLARVVEAVCQSKVAETVVVTGHQAEAVQGALAGAGVAFVHNPHYRDGLSTSLAAGLGVLAIDTDAVLVCLGDMPLVTAAQINALIDAFDPAKGAAICVPTRNGKRGNPVLWSVAFVAELRALAGDVGAKHLIGEHADKLLEVAMDDDAVLVDVDTPEALDALVLQK